MPKQKESGKSGGQASERLDGRLLKDICASGGRKEQPLPAVTHIPRQSE